MWEGDQDGDLIDMAFSAKRVSDRKVWLEKAAARGSSQELLVEDQALQLKGIDMEVECERVRNDCMKEVRASRASPSHCMLTKAVSFPPLPNHLQNPHLRCCTQHARAHAALSTPLRSPPPHIV